ncbi:hypothetical protein [Blastococcus saxobsidens]|uniref:hypothetical protein n=1 Tax=Blastococcus saxobsidens TaxID=138336 RepID=UPI00140F8DA4|nr:hypothetical protein [Blastococcus saxobsidens]
MTVEAEVQEIVGPFAFTVGEDDTLILSATEPAVDKGDDVLVTGIVRSFVVADAVETVP